MAAVATYAELHGLPPEHHPEPEGQSIARWAARKRHALRDDVMPEDLASHLDTNVPDWRFHSRDRAWREHLYDIRTFRAEHKRFPSEDATDSFEHSMGRWLSKQIRLSRDPGKLSADRRHMLDTLVPRWELKLDGNKWLETLDLVCAMHTERGRKPNRKSKDLAERRLGAWLHNQTIRLNLDDPDDAEKIRLLDNLVPGWRPIRMLQYRDAA